MDLTALLASAPGSTSDESFGQVTVDVPPSSWAAAVRCAREELGAVFFDFLTAVEEPAGLRLVCHVAALEPLDRLVLRTRLPDAAHPEVASVADVYAGAAWHERETAEMFGVTFLDADGTALPLERLLLAPGFVGHPLRKEFELDRRLDRPWPGDKEPT